MKQTYAYWRRTHKAQFSSLSEFRAWQSARKAAYRAKHPRIYRAELRRNKKRNRIRTTKLRALIFSEAVRRIRARTPVKPATNVSLRTIKTKPA
jgi:hypothetical protein